MAFLRRAHDLVHNRGKTRDGTATQIIAVSKAARQDNGIKARQRSRFVPNIFRAQAVESIDGTKAILIAIRAGKLDDREFHLSMSEARGSLFVVIIIYHQTGVNHSRNPSEQGQQQAEEETGNPPR